MNIRPSPIAGSWYPGQRRELAESVSRLLAAAPKTRLPGPVWGLLAPHAGHRYSGHVAAHAFNCLSPHPPDVVVIVSPLHQPFPAPVVTTPYDAYETPLGLVPVDQPAAQALSQALRQRAGVGLAALHEDREHAIEIELPFLQVLWSEFRLLPLMLRRQDWPLARALGGALFDVFGTQQPLLIASSDLSHFYPQPVAEELDREMLRRIEAFEPATVVRAEAEGVGFACGRGAIAAVLAGCRHFGANRVTILHHATSGDVSGDYHSVVGYGAAAIWEAEVSSAPGSSIT